MESETRWKDAAPPEADVGCTQLHSYISTMPAGEFTLLPFIDRQ